MGSDTSQMKPGSGYTLIFSNSQTIWIF